MSQSTEWVPNKFYGEGTSWYLRGKNGEPLGFVMRDSCFGGYLARAGYYGKWLWKTGKNCESMREAARFVEEHVSGGSEGQKSEKEEKRG